MINVELTEEEAAKVIAAQRAEIARLKVTLNDIHERAKRLAATKSKLPESFLRAAGDLCGHGIQDETINSDWLDDLHEKYRAILEQKPYHRERMPITDEKFLFAILNGDVQMMNSFKYNLEEIIKISAKN